MVNYPGFDFEVIHRTTADSNWPNAARVSKLKTPHGIVETPAFIFCATRGVIRGVTPAQMLKEKTQIILGNTYHLMLQPGAETIDRLGGLHKMMGWDGPMFTDSGGFQIFSFGGGTASSEIKGNRNNKRPKMLLNIEESGATFRSYIDGNIHKFTPEDSIRAQRNIGADIILVLDECSPYEVGKDYTANSMQLTHRWAKRSIKEFFKSAEGSSGPQALYGIVQGGVYEDLRLESAEFTVSQPYFGYAVGGCLGSDSFELQDVISMSMRTLNKNKLVPHPIHLLGIGGIADIWDGVAKGIDTFYCVNPTRLARHGAAYLRPIFAKNNQSRDHVNLKNSCFKEDDGPLDPECKCYTCLTFSRSYLHHLIKAGEITVIQYLAIHNVAFMNRLMEKIRSAISEDNYFVARKEWFAT